MKALALLLLLASALCAQPSQPSWWWVHAGVAAQFAGNAADCYTSWQQPEANPLLATNGRFVRTGLERKIGVSIGMAALSYVIAWKWPATRKYVAIFNGALGVTFGAVAGSNLVRNPYFRK